uniref:Carboxylesterase type B domain-containing protein n=1 Tax=Acrobeloides nanus TaxID=290746 RepID=A0A914DY23_9BILA
MKWDTDLLVCTSPENSAGLIVTAGTISARIDKTSLPVDTAYNNNSVAFIIDSNGYCPNLCIRGEDGKMYEPLNDNDRFYAEFVPFCDVPREQQLLLPYPTLFYTANGTNLTLIDVLEEDIVGDAPGVAYNIIKQFCEMACKSFTFDGDKEVAAYLGIPYGKPPIGELRFKKPEPAEPWDGIKECTKFGPSCPYDDSFFIDKVLYEGPKITKSEDCLYLNVFAPKFKPGRDQPNGFAVMVWIHGGGYAVHTAAKYGDYGICK